MTLYLFTNLINGKVYVGQTQNDVRWRIANHRHRAKMKPEMYFHNAIAKYGMDAFEFQIIGIAKDLDQLNELEKLWIWALRANARDFGYNITAGGKSATTTAGRPHTQETKNKIGAAQRGKPRSWKFTEETKRKIGEGQRGRPVNWEAIRKSAESNRGKPKSEECRKKISQAMKGRKFTTEWKEKLRLAHAGKPLSKDHAANAAAAHRGLKYKKKREDTK